MGKIIDWKKNEILRNLYNEGYQEGLNQSLQESRNLMHQLVRNLLTHRLGPLPKWAEARLAAADVNQFLQWVPNAFEPLAKLLEKLLTGMLCTEPF